MSRQDKFKPSDNEAAQETQREDIRLEIDLRLHLDEVVNLELERLRASARRHPTRQELCRLACHMYDARRARNKVLGGHLFGEPAWDILLALYCLPARGEMLGVTSLSVAADVPAATGHRWQHLLFEEGLIERGPKVRDLRRQLVRLSDKGRAMLDDYLTRLFYLSTPTPPNPELAGG